MSFYLDDDQYAGLLQLKNGWLWRSEAPTWGLIIMIYGGWYLTLSNWQCIGLPLATGILIVICAWSTSLQHELLHGHPTRWAWVNRIIGYPPIAIWDPYTIYSDTHIQHHNNETLTLPEHDPESYFVTPDKWASMGKINRTEKRVRNTMLGRLFVGALYSCCGSVNVTVQEFKQGKFRYLLTWVFHILWLIVMLRWVNSDFHISPLYYLVFIAYPARVLQMIRSFYEHRSASAPANRSVLNEAAWPWRLLFLNNNYHLVHHDLPSIPWYGLSKIYSNRRSEYISRSGGFVVRGYGEWFRKFWIKEVISPVNPLQQEQVEISGIVMPSNVGTDG